jgi:RNA polymerase primary sigma factor
MGNLSICDLFIRAGADPRARNHQGQTPADVAFAEGNRISGQLISSLIEQLEDRTSLEIQTNTRNLGFGSAGDQLIPESDTVEVTPSELIGDSVEFDNLLNFEPEVSPERHFSQSDKNPDSGTFVALVDTSPTSPNKEGGDWELDLSPTQISGDGISSAPVTTPEHVGERDFLKVRNRGRQSTKLAVVQSGTRLSINPGVCLSWAADILEKCWFNSDDLELLTLSCDGNGDPQELRLNLQRTLEAAGLQLCDEEYKGGDTLWDARSDVSADELAESIEAIFTRATRMPGTGRFRLDKSDEMRLLEPVIRAKQELQLGILACYPAIEIILNVMDDLLHDSADPAIVTMKTIFPSRPEHEETEEFFRAVESLKVWTSNGSVMDGKRRREALEALEAVDLSQTFQKKIVKSLAQRETSLADSVQLDELITIYEAAVERLILEHLSYARRFASRNVEDGEDPEDVFQVAFLGLQRSTRRFDPERGHRFVVYSTFWMKQALTRWRADEGSAIRIPVHRHQKLAELDRALEWLDQRNGERANSLHLAIELGWSLEEVEQHLQMPRLQWDLGNFEKWEGSISEPDQEPTVNQQESERIVSEVLAELQERQAQVVRMRFGIGCEDEMTLEEIGQVYGVTRERIRQIEAKGLQHLRHAERRRRMQSLLPI